MTGPSWDRENAAGRRRAPCGKDVIMEIKITKTTAPKEKPKATELGFGKYFTDHMFLMDYDGEKWEDARIVPFGNLSLL